MTDTVAELISNAYYLSGIVGRGFQAVSSLQISDGLSSLNKVLSQFETDSDKIPFYTSQTFDTVIGQETYSIDNLISVETLTFVKDTLRFSMSPTKRQKYFGSDRAEEIESLPFYYTVERTITGSNIYMYFLPDEVYEFTIHGKFSYASLTPASDISDLMPQFFIDYLEHLLARRLCALNSISLPSEVANEIARMDSKIKTVSSPDLMMRKVSTFSNGFNCGKGFWGRANLYEGWDP